MTELNLINLLYSIGVKDYQILQNVNPNTYVVYTDTKTNYYKLNEDSMEYIVEKIEYLL
jgi:hypothetical protein